MLLGVCVYEFVVVARTARSVIFYSVVCLESLFAKSQLCSCIVFLFHCRDFFRIHPDVRARVQLYVLAEKNVFSMHTNLYDRYAYHRTFQISKTPMHMHIQYLSY